MHYTLELERDHGYAKLYLLEPVTRESLERALEDTYAALISTGCEKVMMDVTLVKFVMSMTELYVFISMFRSRMMLDVEFALLVRPDQMRAVGFIESVAQNRCLRLKGFTNQDAALQWLCEHRNGTNNTLDS